MFITELRLHRRDLGRLTTTTRSQRATRSTQLRIQSGTRGECKHVAPSYYEHMSIRAPYFGVKGEKDAFSGAVLALTALLLALAACWGNSRSDAGASRRARTERFAHGARADAWVSRLIFKSNLLQPLSHHVHVHVRQGGVLPHKRIAMMGGRSSDQTQARQAQSGA